MLIITYLLRLLNLFYVDSWKYLLFVASCCSYYVAIQNRFRVSIWFRISAGLVLGTDYHLNRCLVRFQILISGFRLILGFRFGCTETSPDPNPPVTIPDCDSLIELMWAIAACSAGKAFPGRPRSSQCLSGEVSTGTGLSYSTERNGTAAPICPCPL